MCLLFGFTLPLFSPLSLHLFPRPLLISGDGDEEHAILGHGVCQEWGDLWWVILYYFLNTRSVCLQFLKILPPPSSCTFSLSRLHKIWTVVSVIFLTNKEVTMSYTPNLKGHMIDGIILMWPLSGAAHDCCAKCADTAYLSYKDLTEKAAEGQHQREKV